VIGKRQVEQAVVSAATDIAAFYAARVPVPCTAPTLLVISADALLILSFRVSHACDLRRPVVDSVADGTPAA
jgi:hypothetical protein